MALLKGTKLADELNSPKQRRFFGKDLMEQHQNEISKIYSRKLSAVPSKASLGTE